MGQKAGPALQSRHRNIIINAANLAGNRQKNSACGPNGRSFLRRCGGGKKYAEKMPWSLPRLRWCSARRRCWRWCRPFLVPPDGEYLGYIDWDTLALLFSLMAVMTGFQRLGLFDYLGTRFLKYIGTSRQLLILLVLLPFVFSMVITNDVALITFVPFGMVVLQMAGQQRLVVPLVVLQTAAANLGSMLTPMGNPRTSISTTSRGWARWIFVQLMLALCGGLGAVPAGAGGPVPQPAHQPGGGAGGDPGPAGTALLLRRVWTLSALHRQGAAGSGSGGSYRRFPAGVQPQLLAAVDYSLLGTFVAFFVFIGNIGPDGEFPGHAGIGVGRP